MSTTDIGIHIKLVDFQIIIITNMINIIIYILIYVLCGVLMFGPVFNFSLKEYIARCKQISYQIAIPMTIGTILLWPLFLLIDLYYLLKK